MDKIIEDANYLTIGKFTIDVSNVSVYRKKVARRVWDEAVKKMQESEENNLDLFNDIVDKYGLYFIRQDFSVLRLRYSFSKAIFSYIKRYMLSLKYIRKTNEAQYDQFQEWAYFNLTGTKKKELEKVSQIQKLELKMLEEMDKLNLNPDQLTELLQIFLQETAGNMSTSVNLQKA